MKNTSSKKGAQRKGPLKPRSLKEVSSFSPVTKVRPPRIYRTKTGRPYIKHKGKKVYLNFGKKTNDMSNISILKLFLKYLRTKKRDIKNKPTKAQVIYPDTDRIELENRQRVDSQVRNYLRDKYEKINEMDKEEEKKRKEAKELADERRRAAEAKQRQDIADAAERTADINRAIAREQALQRELQADRRATQNIRRAQIQAAPQAQIQFQPQAQPPPQAQGQPDAPPPPPPQAQIQAPPPPPPMLKTQEQKDAEKKQRKEDMDLLRKAGYPDADIKGMPLTSLKTTAAGIRSYEARGIAIEEYKKKLDAEKKEKEMAAKTLEDKNRMIQVIGGLSRDTDPGIKIRDLSLALRDKLQADGHKRLGFKHSKGWIALMIVNYDIDVGNNPDTMKRRVAEYAGLVKPEEKTKQEGKGYNTLAGMINKKYTADKIKKYLDKDMYKSKTKKAELVVMLINKMNTNRAVDKKISEELDIDTVEDEGGTYERAERGDPFQTPRNQIGRGVEGGQSPLQGLTTTQIDGLMSDEKRYLGTVASDEIKTLKPKGTKYAFIMSTDKASKPGQHWIAVYISGKDDKTVEVYDPLGTYEPTKEFLEQIKTLVDKMKLDHYLLLKVNKIKNQSDTSDTCGWFAVKFLKERFMGNRFKFSTGFTQLKEDEIQKYKKQNGYGFDTFI